jgi:hypothetical protein
MGARRGAVAAAEVRAELADEAYADLLPTLRTMKAEGLTLAKMAEKLNEAGHKTRRGKLWSPTQVSRVLDRDA